ncbi:hypothetical protein ILUMI_19164, partial [Ignelater luminosus]
MVGIYCAIEGCWGSKESKHRFPNPQKDMTLFNKWMTLCGNERLSEITPEKVYNNYRICKLHFTNEDFIANNKLNKQAYPSKNLPVGVSDTAIVPEEPASQDVLSSLDHTSKSVLSTAPEKHAFPSAYQDASFSLEPTLRSAVSSPTNAEATKFTKQYCFEEVINDLDHVTKRFFECQVQNIKKKAKGRRYTTDDKILALVLLKQSGNAYKYLSKIFALPSKQTLTKFLNKISIRPGMNNAIFNVLKAEADSFKNPLDKYCMLIFDEMSIATHISYNQKEDHVEGFDNSGNNFANHAQTFMIRGIRRRWKQPIFYDFTSGPAKCVDIATTIKKLVAKCREVGLVVCAFICDQGTNNSAAINHLQRTAKWEHLITAYKMDPYFGSLRSMPKLTDAHVIPEKISKMKVACCTQAISRTTAIAINLMARS